ncbi:MAG: M61 family metallopeptidase [Acidobacteriota bacterium]|nr:MAG: M61 family metallopeptidase [Acidobacteriota bacterium]
MTNNRLVNSLFAFAVLIVLLSASALAQSRVDYEISFPNAYHHEAEISVTFSGAPAGRPLEVRMSRSSPGRYAAHEFARNVYNVRAMNESGGELAIDRPHAFQWNVIGGRGRVTVRYTLFGDLGSGTWTGIDHTMAHLSIPATFMWARGFENAPVTVRFRRPSANWKIATQLAPTSDPEVFTAPHMQYLMDSPTMLGDLRFREWPIQSNGKTYTIRLAINDAAPDSDVDAFTEMTKKIVDAQIAVFGEAPDFDYGTYTFISNYVPQIGGDGMEHRNSTSLTSTRSIRGNPRANLGTVSHEFFHAWNVERLRPKTLEPFNFEDANVSDGLWLAEGFTQYYGGLIMRRAGFSDDASYGRGLGFTINNVVNGPGRMIHSPVEMSRRAVFEDGGISTAPTNSQNIFISYYTYGAAVALGLDLTLRTRFPGKTLDDYMRELWRSYGKHQKNYAPARPYTIPDLRKSLANLTGDEAFAKEFFDRYIEGREVVDYEALMAKFGFELRKMRPGKLWLGAQLQAQNNQLTTGRGVAMNGPLYRAGIDRGDAILTFDGQAVGKPLDVEAILEKHKPGDSVAVEVMQRGVKRTVQVTLEEDPQIAVAAWETTGRELTPEMKKLREAWLGAR